MDRLIALETIAQIGQPLKASLGSKVVRLADDESDIVREQALRMLPEFAESPAQAAKTLAEAMIEHSRTRAKMHEDYHAGRSDLSLEQLAAASRYLDGHAAVVSSVLASMGEAAIPEALKLVHDKSPDARGQGLQLIRKMPRAGHRDAAIKLISEVERLLADPDPAVKALAESAVKELRSK
ncbi:MAG: hypothetical protein U0791_09145 [Gemmataceae bacterium]